MLANAEEDKASSIAYTTTEVVGGRVTMVSRVPSLEDMMQHCGQLCEGQCDFLFHVVIGFLCHFSFSFPAAVCCRGPLSSLSTVFHCIRDMMQWNTTVPQL